ncbi:hypothetical protein Ahy_B01g053676 [Arachis hypogaea]|uniref:UMP kinase n=1 Tax=Arachis hypogaea TaxID=3818 RepID=A0A445AS86_ARAHY|nr:hypothetical protein Ahy_B01g053676 [Arachis hypogaea]
MAFSSSSSAANFVRLHRCRALLLPPPLPVSFHSHIRSIQRIKVSGFHPPRRPVQLQPARHSPHHRIQSSAPLTTAKKHVHGPSSPTASWSSVVSRHLQSPSSLLVVPSLQVQGPAVQSWTLEFIVVVVRKPEIPSMSPFALSMNESSNQPIKWQRVLLKVSGEALAGDHSQNIDPKITMAIAREVAAVTRLGIEVAIVVGGGNIFRGSSWAGCSGLDRSSADYIG